MAGHSLRDPAYRQASLAVIDDIMGFVVMKLAGLGLVLVGVLEGLFPKVLDAIALSHPWAFAGVGLSMLGGRYAVRIVKHFADALDEGLSHE